MSARDLATLAAADFQPHVGEPLTLRADGAPELELTLTEVAELPGGPAPGSGRAPFAITLLGPAEPILAQQIVPLEHPGLGRLELFVVPLGVGADGARYEAVFS